MSLEADNQSLETAGRVQLVTIDGTKWGAGKLNFHYLTPKFTPAELTAAAGDEEKLRLKSIWFGGVEFKAWPYQITGLEASTSGQTPEPELNASNINGALTSLCWTFDDMAKFKVYIYQTNVKYLDARNFTGGNPSADPLQVRTQLFMIDEKLSEDDLTVRWRLGCPYDVGDLLIPTRQITQVCTWAMRGQYRTGDGCDYNGSLMFDEKGNPVDDPAKDKCGGLVKDCKARHGQQKALPFGGFVSASLIRR